MRPYARDPPASATSTTSAPSSAKNSSNNALSAIWAPIIRGTIVNAWMSGSIPGPDAVNV